MYEQKYLGSNISLVKGHNLQAILLTFLLNERISRVELAQKTALSTTTITNLTAELLEQGIIVEVEGEPRHERRKVGRPRKLLRIVPHARYAVGVHIGIGVFRVAVTNLRAEIICNNMERFDLATPAEVVLNSICDLIDKTLLQSGVDRERVIGVGVGASGLVNHATGVNVLAPSLNWHNLDIKAPLEARLSLPVCVENNVRTMALAEAFFGAGRGVDVLAFVYGRTGVGAGFVVNGRLFRGSEAGAGEIGHTIVVPRGGDECSCGNRGCLETLVSEKVLIKQAHKLASENPNSILADHLRQESLSRPIDNIFLAAREGDQLARQMIEERAYYLGIALANLVNVLNPQLILLGGMFAEGYDLFQPTAEETMRSAAFAGMGEKVQLKTTSFGWRAGVLGGASLALTTLFYLQATSV